MSYGDEDSTAFVLDNPILGCGSIPDFFLDLEGKKSLTVFDLKDNQYAGEMVSLVCRKDKVINNLWYLTIKLSSGRTMSFTEYEVSAVTRHL